MTYASHGTSLIKSPWTDSLCNLVSVVEDDLLIACPFVKRSGTDHILSQLDGRGLTKSVRVGLITDLRPESALAGSMDLDALAELGEHIPNFRLTHLPGVHAKVYIADVKMAIVTSGNLTHSGLRGNVEYGIALRNKAMVREIRADIEGFGLLGADIATEGLAMLSSEMRELKALFSQAQRSIHKQARRVFEESLEEAHLRLLRQRVKSRSINAVFSDTIRFLLGRGPLQTSEIHPLLQSIHPDICDDSVDRIIDGVSYGKKWKHHVRNAQQYLKRQGEVSYDGNRWQLSTTARAEPIRGL